MFGFGYSILPVWHYRSVCKRCAFFKNRNWIWKKLLAPLCSNSVTNFSEMSNSRKHPPHLKGRAIGMFYAQKSRGKKKKQEDHKRLAVYMHKTDEQHLWNLLESIHNRKYRSSPSLINFDFKKEFWQDLAEERLRGQNTVNRVPLLRNPDLDEKLHLEFEKRIKSEKYAVFQRQRSKLPSYAMQESLLSVLQRNQVMVVKGETGCGKTTQVPQYILDGFLRTKNGSLCKIICTQPRRISAIGVAERVAQERCVSVGRESDTGYQIRLESKLPRTVGSVLFCTTGVLLQHLQSNPYLDGISHIIVDEVHERDILSDFLLINLKDILAFRKDLKVILMSATINAEEFSAYFGDCPLVEIPGFTHPVEKFMLEDMIEITNYQPEERNIKQDRKYGRRGHKASPEDIKWKSELDDYLKEISNKYSASTINTLRNWNENKIDINLIMEMIKHISYKMKDGAILVFLPGWSDIKDLHKLLMQSSFFPPSRFIVIPLHSLMPTIQQRDVFEKPPRGMRKIVLATNIAETSITIDDVVYVIDSGKMKMKNIDISSNLQILQPEWVALANAKQRSGRAGRTQPGVCYHMFSKLRESKLDAYQSPEMLRSSLEELILNIKILKLGKVVPFLQKAMNPPNMNTVSLSLKTLVRLNALTEDEHLTPLGYYLAKLPMDVHSGKMILLGAIFSCLDPILSVAASLSFKDAFVVVLGKEGLVDERKREFAGTTQSDHLMFARALSDWEEAKAQGTDRTFCWNNFLSSSTLKMLSDLKRQYAEHLKALHFIERSDPKYCEYNRNSDNELLLKAIICAGLYPNVAKVTAHAKRKSNHNRPVRAITEDMMKVQIHPRSVNAFETELKSDWLVYHLKIKSSVISLFDTMPITAYPLLFFGGKLEIGKVRGYETISVDDWIVMQCPSRKARLVMELRKELDGLLEHKINNPGVSNWDPVTKEGLVLRAITELITWEETFTVQELESWGMLQSTHDEDEFSDSDV